MAVRREPTGEAASAVAVPMPTWHAAAAEAVAGRARKAASPEGRLVIVSNRLPESSSVGGLVSALRPAIERMPGSLWLGWSGRSAERPPEALCLRPGFGGRVSIGAIDLAAGDVDGHYHGFCNRTLWPVFHSLPERAAPEAEGGYPAYRRVNEIFAQMVAACLDPADRVWVHDYHLLPLGHELRRRGFGGRIGLFLHVPFPSPAALARLASADALVEATFAFDLLGFQTARDLANYASAAARFGGPRSDSSRPALGVYPVGIDPDGWRATAAAAPPSPLLAGLAGRKVLLGVDRLDYTKGIPERLRAFERLLERRPPLRGRVTLLQIAAPSRLAIPEYARHREEVEALVAAVNARFGADGWQPIRYVFRTCSEEELAALYRAVDVCLVTPLRDGMNLVAKEFVAAQVRDPAVLVLSRFAGAAEALDAALLVDPTDLDATAAAIESALAMPLAERIRRHRALLARVRAGTAFTWAHGFDRDLAGHAAPEAGEARKHGVETAKEMAKREEKKR